MSESWYGTDSKAWAAIGILLGLTLLIVGLAAGCEAQGTQDHPLYVQCEENK